MEKQENKKDPSIEAERYHKLAQEHFYEEQSLMYLERAAHYFSNAGDHNSSLKMRIEGIVRATALKGLDSWERIEATYSLVFYSKKYDSQNYRYHAKIYLEVFSRFMCSIQEQIYEVEQGASLGKSRNLVHDQIYLELDSKGLNIKGFPLYERIAKLHKEIFGEDEIYSRYVANQAFFLRHSLQKSNHLRANALYKQAAEFSKDEFTVKYYRSLMTR